MTAMLGDAHGPQAYMNQVGVGQVLAQSGTETLAANQANNAVARVFQMQARELLVAEQADLKAANDLRLAIQAAVARQVAFVAGDPGQAEQAGQRAGHESRRRHLP